MATDAGRSRIRNCGYCLTELTGKIRFCELCGCPHHDDCWQEGGGCTVPGCAGGPGAAPTISPPAPYVTVGTPPAAPPAPPAAVPSAYRPVPPQAASIAPTPPTGPTAPMAPMAPIARPPAPSIPPSTTGSAHLGSAMRDPAWGTTTPVRAGASVLRRIVGSILILIVVGGAAFGSFQAGVRQGREEGITIGRREGDTAGYERGSRDGRLSGYEDGYAAGTEDGYDAGYLDGSYSVGGD